MMSSVRMQLQDLAKVLIWNLNSHKHGRRPDIWLFGSRRSGTTLLAQVIGANAAVKIVDQPFSIPSSQHLQLKLISKFTTGHILDMTSEEQADCISYITKIRNGHLHVGEPWRIWSGNFHLRSNRILFKVTDAPGLPSVVQKTYQDHILITCRHPISQAISCMHNRWSINYRPFFASKWYIETFLQNGLYDRSLAIVDGSSALSKYVLLWCLENKPLFDGLKQNPKWGFVTYEHFVRNYRDVIDDWSKIYGLPDVDAMLKMVKKPSISMKLSSDTAKADVKNGIIKDRLFRWRAYIDKHDEKRLMEIVDSFGIEEYKVWEDTCATGYRPPPL